jgi:hypothetical protein
VVCGVEEALLTWEADTASGDSQAQTDDHTVSKHVRHVVRSDAVACVLLNTKL